MRKKLLTSMLAVTAAFTAFSLHTAGNASAAEANALNTRAITIQASEAALKGVMYKDTASEKAIEYNAEHKCIVGIGEFSSASYTVPEGTNGSYDIYMQLSKGGNAFVCGSTPITAAVSGGAMTVPSLPIVGCTFAQMTSGTYMEDLGTFQIMKNVSLQSGDIIKIGGVAGNEFAMNGSYGSMMPVLGDMMLYPAGTAVEVGYSENRYTPSNQDVNSSDPISGLDIAWLGSSVTYGQQAGGYSMADQIAASHAATNCYKYAISGTTLANHKTDASMPTDGEGFHGSYVARLKTLDKSQKYDLFIVQLSTNDATGGIPMGKISDSMKLEDQDDSTVLGAIEYIIAYVKQTWGCPVMFYTGTKYESEQYAQMVTDLLKIQNKWGIGVVDLWNNEKMNAVSEEDYAKYMKDTVHPTKDGYVDWWTPVFEKEISAYYVTQVHKMTHIKAKASTYFNKGNIGYYSCSLCDKLFLDADGKQEITLNKTVIAKKTLSGVSSLKATGKKNKEITLSWKKNTKATGYQIQYCTKKSFSKNVKKIDVPKNTTVKKTISKLKKKTKYYVRIRGYVTNPSNGKKAYSKWSSAKSATTK